MSSVILDSGPIGFNLPVKPPFIAMAHHLDFYPAGNGRMEPIDYLDKRNNGDDFDMDSPWRMYHGNMIPGFPAHPHRGFETVTIVEQGVVDHSDSLGSTGRYGAGDVQWLTAGSGIMHCEMFPLVDQDRDNTLELFQLWLNLPARRKMVSPYYKMLWKEDIPVVKETNAKGKTASIKIVAGNYGEVEALPPTPDSWASAQENGVRIWLVSMEPGASFSLPPASPSAGRMLYFYSGEDLRIEGEEIKGESYADLVPDRRIAIENGQHAGRLLILEGEPIEEPIAIRGPFVMNDETEVLRAMRDYQRTAFGGWPWPRLDPVNPADSGRFARHPGGETDLPKGQAPDE